VVRSDDSLRGPWMVIGAGAVVVLVVVVIYMFVRRD
jgi:hypothetical protein